MTNEYDVIRAAYGDRKAKRTGLPYIRHIDQGLLILKHLKVDSDVLSAWCLHPIFQLDEYLVPLMSGESQIAFPSRALSFSTKVTVFGMEYRSVANAFLTKDTFSGRMPIPSVIPEVNVMLVADKIQNYRDARLHLFPQLEWEGKERLNYYFGAWLTALRVSSEDRTTFEAILAEDDLWSRKKK